MKVKNRYRPSFEQLENRVTPSVTTMFSGNTLSIRADNAPTDIRVTATGPNSVSVLANGNLLGNFGNVGNINITEGSAKADKVRVLLAGNTLSSNLNVTLGNGSNDQIVINNGSITGNVNGTFGGGTNDSFSIGPSSATNLLGTTTIRGSNATGAMVSLGALSTLNNTTLVDASFAEAQGASVNGSLSISNGSLGVASSVTIGQGPAAIGGSLNYMGGAAPTNLTINGVVGGYVSYNSPGPDTISMSGTARVGGNVNLNFGNNTNIYTLDSAFKIGGNLMISAGNGGNAMTLGDGVGGRIGGNVSVRLGNGSNSFTLANGFEIDGTQVSYTGGTGSDHVTIQNVDNGFSLNANLGGALGSAVDTADLSAVSTLGSATLTYGVLGTPGVNKILILPGTVTFPLIENNYP